MTQKKFYFGSQKKYTQEYAPKYPYSIHAQISEDTYKQICELATKQQTKPSQIMRTALCNYLQELDAENVEKDISYDEATTAWRINPKKIKIEPKESILFKKMKRNSTLPIEGNI